MFDVQALCRWPVLAISACLACLASSASALTPDQAFTLWSRCDSTAFQPEVIQALNPDSALPTDSRNGQMWLQASNGHPEGSSELVYQHALSIGGVPVRRYTTSNADMGTQGRVYAWGFELEGALGIVFAHLQPLIDHTEQLVNDGLEIRRTEIKGEGVDWRYFPVPMDEPPGLQHIERQLVIRPGSEIGLVDVRCELRGNVTAALLASHRPDLTPIQYPHILDAAEAESTPLPSATSEIVAHWLQTTPDWQARFHSITLYVMQGESLHILTIRPEHGLLRIEDEQGKAGVTIKTSLAGLVDLKSHVIGGRLAQSVLLLDQLQLQWPEHFKLGARLQIDGNMIQHPDLTGESASSRLDCEVGARFEAKLIAMSNLAVLKAKAFPLSCKTASGGQRHYAGLPTLGLFLPLDGQDDLGREQVNNYMNMEVTP